MDLCRKLNGYFPPPSRGVSEGFRPEVPCANYLPSSSGRGSRFACRLDSDMGDFREVSERSAVASFARSSSNFAMRVRRAFIDS